MRKALIWAKAKAYFSHEPNLLRLKKSDEGLLAKANQA